MQACSRKLLLENYFDQQRVWLYFVELIPAFGLYRGLYEFASYAFRGSYTGGKGLSFNEFGDPNCHMGYVMGIFAAEWAVFLLLAWYLDQVGGLPCRWSAAERKGPIQLEHFQLTDRLFMSWACSRWQNVPGC